MQKERDITTGYFISTNLCKRGHDISRPEFKAANRACKICKRRNDTYAQVKRRLNRRIALKKEILMIYEVEKRYNEEERPNRDGTNSSYENLSFYD